VSKKVSTCNRFKLFHKKATQNTNRKILLKQQILKSYFEQEVISLKSYMVVEEVGVPIE